MPVESTTIFALERFPVGESETEHPIGAKHVGCIDIQMDAIQMDAIQMDAHPMPSMADFRMPPAAGSSAAPSDGPPL